MIQWICVPRFRIPIASLIHLLSVSPSIIFALCQSPVFLWNMVWNCRLYRSTPFSLPVWTSFPRVFLLLYDRSISCQKLYLFHRTSWIREAIWLRKRGVSSNSIGIIVGILMVKTQNCTSDTSQTIQSFPDYDKRLGIPWNGFKPGSTNFEHCMAPCIGSHFVLMQISEFPTRTFKRLLILSFETSKKCIHVEKREKTVIVWPKNLNILGLVCGADMKPGTKAKLGYLTEININIDCLIWTEKNKIPLETCFWIIYNILVWLDQIFQKQTKYLGTLYFDYSMGEMYNM